MNCSCCHQEKGKEIKATSLATIDFSLGGKNLHGVAPLCQVCTYLFSVDIPFHEQVKQMVTARTLIDAFGPGKWM